MSTIYLDHAAATPVDDRVLSAMQPYWQEQFYNPSATYLAGRRSAADLKNWHQRVATCLGVKASEVIFTAGGTEADNLAVQGITKNYPQANLIISAIEHSAVLQAAKQYNYQLLPVTKRGVVDTAKLEHLINDQTVLLSVMHANNEVGMVQPLPEISRLVAKMRQQRTKKGNQLPLYLHSDASQTANYLSVKPSRLGVDLMTLNGGKLYGPKQSGALWVRSGVNLQPLLYGGGQERGLRSGTESLALVAGFTTALELAQSNAKQEADRLRELQALFEAKLQQRLPQVIINSQGLRLPNIIHVTFPGVDNERLMMQLDEAGIMCALGSACSASNDEPSHVLTAMGLNHQQIQSSLRFSMGQSTTAAQINRTVKVLAELIH